MGRVLSEIGTEEKGEFEAELARREGETAHHKAMRAGTDAGDGATGDRRHAAAGMVEALG
jgi:hypothetical protein